MQRYNLPIKITKSLAPQGNVDLRKAARLFFWLKTHRHPTSFNVKSVRAELQAAGFSYFTTSKYLAVLKSNGWVSQDPAGKCFLRGRKFFCALAGTTNRFHAVVVPAECTESTAAWNAFIAGIQISQVLDKAKHANRYPSPPPSQDGVKTAGEQPLAAGYISKALEVSRSTASRMRTRAAAGGYISTQAWYRQAPKQVACWYGQHFYCAKKRAVARFDDGSPGGLPQFVVDRMVWKPDVNARFEMREGVIGKGWERMPDIVTVTGLQYKQVTVRRTAKELRALYLCGKIPVYTPAVGWESPWYSV